MRDGLFKVSAILLVLVSGACASNQMNSSGSAGGVEDSARSVGGSSENTSTATAEAGELTTKQTMARLVGKEIDCPEVRGGFKATFEPSGEYKVYTYRWETWSTGRWWQDGDVVKIRIGDAQHNVAVRWVSEDKVALGEARCDVVE